MRRMMFYFLIGLGTLCGCQTADPASRANRTEYGDLVSGITARDKSTMTINLTVGDGLYASADGGGDRTDSQPVQTTSPSASTAWGASTAGVGGEQRTDAVSGLEKILKGLKSGVLPALSPSEKKAVGECVGGACEDTP